VLGLGDAGLGEIDVSLDQAQGFVVDLKLVAQLDKRSAFDLECFANEMIEV
jgi:hypothetical protein